MNCYLIKFKILDDKTGVVYSMCIDARNIDSAKAKIQKRTKQAIEIVDSSIIGHY